VKENLNNNLANYRI